MVHGKSLRLGSKIQVIKSLRDFMCWPVGSNNNPGSLLMVSPTAIDLRTSCELVLQL